MRPDTPQGLTRDIGRVQGDADGEGHAEAGGGMNVMVPESETMTVPVAMVVVMVAMIVARMVMPVMLMGGGRIVMIVIAGVMGI